MAGGVGVVIGSLLGHFLRRVVLTRRGLEIWSFGCTVVPWSQISGVVVGGSRRTEWYVGVLVLPYGAVKKLSAPRATLAIGDRDVAVAREALSRRRTNSGVV